MKKEANITDSLDDGNLQQDSDVNNVLSGYKSDGDPEIYEECYLDLKRFVENSLDIYKHELGMILYPLLVHMYLELVYNGHTVKAVAIMKRFGPEQDVYYQDDLKKIALVTKRDHMNGNELTDTFKSNQFIIRMSRDTLSLLKRHLHEKKASIILNIIQEHLYFDMYEGVARNKAQIDATSGAVTGEATRQGNYLYTKYWNNCNKHICDICTYNSVRCFFSIVDNKVKVLYGLPKAPDIQSIAAPVEDEEENNEQDTPDKPKKKKTKKDPFFSKKTKSDPNAPSSDRIPFPEL